MSRGAGRRGFAAGAAAALAALKIGAAPFAKRAAAAAGLPRRIYRIDLEQCDLGSVLRLLSSKHFAPRPANITTEARIQQAVRDGWLAVEELP